MISSKKVLVKIAEKVEKGKRLTPTEIETLQKFIPKTKDHKALLLLKQLALPASLLFGFAYTVFSSNFEAFVKSLPSWTYFSPTILTGIDYLWDLLGEPVGKANIIYHIPNVILYSFGILGIKKLFDALDKRTWMDRVLGAQKVVQEKVTQGLMNFALSKGHSILFIGKGDFIGAQFVLNHDKNNTVTVSLAKPNYTNTWCFYDADTTYEDLKTVLTRSDFEHAGEYMFFPVKDDQIFLPAPSAYDLSPHKLDILCQNIRMIERSHKQKPRRIIIVGDKFHKSYVVSVDQKKAIKNSEDIITLSSIAQKYRAVSLIDPTDIVLQKILELADGRKIVFRATREGIAEYKQRFFERLQSLGYKTSPKKKGILTIGYDLFEDQTEQQTLSRKIDDYYPVVLSKNVRDALIRNGYRKHEFLYVPELVLATLTTTAAQQ
jgi:hypothetical protein